MSQVWTIQKLLGWMVSKFTEKKIDSPRLTAELLLSAVLQMERIELYMNFDKTVSRPQLDELHNLVKRCLQNEPVQYLVGRCEFYSLSLIVSSDCLIPRPETELLVEKAVEFLRRREGTQYVCDLCTGCGCIAIAIAKNVPDVKIIATDISDKALKIAARNVEKYKLQGQIRLLQGDLFEPIINHLDTKIFDLIVCNPPYVSQAEYEKLDAKVKHFEPKIALDGGKDGLDIYRRISKDVANYLKTNGALMLEIGFTQAEAVKNLLQGTNAFDAIKVEKDLSKNDRIIIALRSLT